MKTWIFKLEVADSWVADGFDCTEEHLEEIAGRILPYAYSHEVKLSVVKAPDAQVIRDLQSGAVEVSD